MSERGYVTEDDLTDAEKVEQLKDNHIWLNAFHCIRPSSSFLQDVGRMVVDKLDLTDLRTNGIGDPDEKGRRAGESSLVYLSINKS